MAGSDSFPSTDNAKSLFAQNFSTLITATPAAFGLSVLDATTLAGYVGTYVSALATSTNPMTKGPSATVGKNTARAQMMVVIRGIAKRLQANGAITAIQKTNLGLIVPDKVRTPILPPTTRPVLAVASLASRSLDIRIADEATPTKRARPRGVDGAYIYSFVAASGTPAPANLSAWTFRGIAKKADYLVDFDSADIGKIAHVRALWISTRGANGPVSDEVSGSIAA